MAHLTFDLNVELRRLDGVKAELRAARLRAEEVRGIQRELMRMAAEDGRSQWRQQQREQDRQFFSNHYKRLRDAAVEVASRPNKRRP